MQNDHNTAARKIFIAATPIRQRKVSFLNYLGALMLGTGIALIVMCFVFIFIGIYSDANEMHLSFFPGVDSLGACMLSFFVGICFAAPGGLLCEDVLSF